MIYSLAECALVVLAAAPQNAVVDCKPVATGRPIPTLDDQQVTSRADARLDGKSGLDQFLGKRYMEKHHGETGASVDQKSVSLLFHWWFITVVSIDLTWFVGNTVFFSSGHAMSWSHQSPRFVPFFRAAKLSLWWYLGQRSVTLTLKPLK